MESPKILPLGQKTWKHIILKAGGKEKRNICRDWRETLKRTAKKCVRQFKISKAGRSFAMMLKAMFPDELHTFNAHFDALDKNLTVKSTSPPEAQEVPVSTLDVRKVLRRADMKKAACPDLDHVLIIYTVPRSYYNIIGTLRRMFPTARRQPPSSLSSKSLHCLFFSPIQLKILVLKHTSCHIPARLNPHQFDFRVSRYTEDDVSIGLSLLFIFAP